MKNAVFVEAEAAGDLMFYGAGAGGLETRLRRARRPGLRCPPARHRRPGPRRVEPRPTCRSCRSRSVLTRYQITLTVLDQPGVLAAIATVFSQHGVSVENVEQSVRSLAPGDSVATATLVIGTHKALESDLAATVDRRGRQRCGEFSHLGSQSGRYVMRLAPSAGNGAESCASTPTGSTFRMRHRSSRSARAAPR